MPWKEASAMSLRLEFVLLALRNGVNLRSLCRRFGVSAPTAYKWIERYREGGVGALADRSRRPQRSPFQTSTTMEQAIVEMRSHQGWGGRKIHRRLKNLGHQNVPAPSTITEICRRNGLCSAPERPQRDLQRFEASAPNLLWQIDFMGDFALYQGRCYTLTVLDDHSRFSLGISACSNQQHDTVKRQLQTTFRRYGLPQRILADNGGPWGSCGNDGYTQLAAWFFHLGITLSHSRVCHPQTLGKDERFHRTLQYELVSRRTFTTLDDCQNHYDRWRTIYNCERPHEALRMAVPASRYQPSPQEFPEILPPIEYGADDFVRKVDTKGTISFQNRTFKIGRGFSGYPVALRPTTTDGLYNVYFCHQLIDHVDLNHKTSHNV
jgi:transposase InsO family protein